MAASLVYSGAHQVAEIIPTRLVSFFAHAPDGSEYIRTSVNQMAHGLLRVGTSRSLRPPESSPLLQIHVERVSATLTGSLIQKFDTDGLLVKRPYR